MPSHRLGVVRHASVAKAKIRVAPARRPCTGLPPGHRYQIATELQTPINRMPIARRAKPIHRPSRPTIGFTFKAFPRRSVAAMAHRRCHVIFDDFCDLPPGSTMDVEPPEVLSGV